MEVAIVIVALIAFVGFRQWLQHQRRLMIHRERLKAIETGLALPPLEQEVKRNEWNGQRILLLGGLTWISLGIGLFVVLKAILAHPEASTDLPQGLHWLGIAPVLIGLSHLIVYLVGKKEANYSLAKGKQNEHEKAPGLTDCEWAWHCTVACGSVHDEGADDQEV